MQQDKLLNQAREGAKAERRTPEQMAEFERKRDEWEASHIPVTAAENFDIKFQQYLTSNNFLLGHRLLFNSAITPLQLVVHLLQSSTNDASRVIKNVLEYCAAPPKMLRDRLAIATAPYLWKVHESRLEPIRNRQSLDGYRLALERFVY